MIPVVLINKLCGFRKLSDLDCSLKQSDMLTWYLAVGDK